MAEAETGDDVLREDPTVLRLEGRAAELTGKEAALFTPSGTFANQLALFTWVPRGREVYLNEYSHIVQHEAGASAHLSGAFLRTFVPAKNDWAEWEDVAPRLRSERDQHVPVPALVCLENALWNGTVQPPESMAAVKKGAEKAGIRVHLDGARLFNAAAHLNVEASQITSHVDSVMFCVSKGLGAPVGSILCGPRDFIDEAFYNRKIMGGGMRQVGILAAAGLVALEQERPRLAEDHALAREMAEAFGGLNEVFELVNPQPQINMLFLRLRRPGAAAEGRFMELLKKAGILTYGPEAGVFRFVTHRDIDYPSFRQALAELPAIADELRAA